MEVSIEEISEDFPAYLQRVQAGESFIIVAKGKAFTPLGNSKATAEIKPRHRSNLSDAFQQLRQICQEENYVLEIPPRHDLSNNFLDDQAVNLPDLQVALD